MEEQGRLRVVGWELLKSGAEVDESAGFCLLDCMHMLCPKESEVCETTSSKLLPNRHDGPALPKSWQRGICRIRETEPGKVS